MLDKLLFKNQDKKQLLIAIIGAFLGITFLITSIHFLIRINEFGEGNDILGPNTIIVQKRVSNSSSLGLTKTDFSYKEIEKMKAKPFISDVQPVITNSFDVSFQTDDELVPYFRSDIFIQTVDPNFLDISPQNWTWEKGNDFVPIIMPRDFLIMLNTFMSANGIPQVSDDLAMEIKFKFTLKNGSTKEYVNVKIIGFTNTVSSILVPKSFMEYGNTHYSNGKEQLITQVMISGEESEFGLIEEMLNEKGLNTKDSQMVVGRLKSIVGTLFMVVLGISIIAVFLSGLVLIQYLQLLMTKNAYEVRTLLRLGYQPKKIIHLFFIYFIKIFGIIALLGIFTFFIFKLLLDNVFASGGLFIDTGFTYQSIGAIIFAYCLFALSSYRVAKKGIISSI